MARQNERHQKRIFKSLFSSSMSSVTPWLALLHRSLHANAQVGGAVGHDDAGGAEGGDFVLGCAAAAADDGAGMAHALTRRRRLPGDERRHRLFDVLFDVL